MTDYKIVAASCPKCGQTLRGAAGSMVKCPKCGASLQLPGSTIGSKSDGGYKAREKQSHMKGWWKDVLKALAVTALVGVGGVIGYKLGYGVALDAVQDTASNLKSSDDSEEVEPVKTPANAIEGYSDDFLTISFVSCAPSADTGNLSMLKFYAENKSDVEMELLLKSITVDGVTSSLSANPIIAPKSTSSAYILGGSSKTPQSLAGVFIMTDGSQEIYGTPYHALEIPFTNMP